MISAQDISSRFALDTQSVGKLRLQAKQDPDAGLKAAAQQFEGIFLNMLLKSMRDGSPGNPIFDNDQSKLYTQMFDQQLAQKLATGKGIGLADMIVKQMSRQTVAPDVADKTPVAPTEAGKLPLRALFPQLVAPAPTVAPVSTAEKSSAISSAQAFLDKLLPHADEAGKALGIPPHFLLGQAALESGWGQRQILAADGKNSHNLFGIKAGKSWTGDVAAVTTTEYQNGMPQKKTELFRAYSSYAESFRDYARLLQNNPRYQAVLGQGGDAAGFARALQDSGYATDPRYADKLTRVLNSQTMRQALVG
ncbi:MAG: flagellar assembly peptidoglycan hydrolase FlgJ [Sulfuricella sp.]|nr:flagellar assembly peptidoglycan hydrolase FlgJ [Sulfuricella sp.]